VRERAEQGNRCITPKNSSEKENNWNERTKLGDVRNGDRWNGFGSGECSYKGRKSVRPSEK